MREPQQRNSEYKKLIEAALFVSSKAMGVEELAQTLGIASVGSVRPMVEELISDYDSRDSSISIYKIGDKYIMSVRENYANRVNDLAGAPDVSRGALRILAYVSKNQPIMQNNIVKNFGSSTYLYMKELLEKDFVKTNKAGRTKKIETTEKFKEYFNL